MKKKLLMVLISVSMIASVFTGCGNSTEAKDSGKAQTEQADTKEDSADKADEEQEYWKKRLIRIRRIVR